MVKVRLLDPQFVKTAIKAKDYPKLVQENGDVRIEVAVIGRSNVGKSSLLNALFQTKKLVKTSSTPGKTRGISFFIAGEQYAFVDLPGYGFAKVSKTEQKTWGPMVEGYLRQREELCLLLLLIDVRRGILPDDEKMLHWADHYEIPVQVILTKADKVSKNNCEAMRQKVARQLGMEKESIILFSTVKNQGRKELLASLAQMD